MGGKESTLVYYKGAKENFDFRWKLRFPGVFFSKIMKSPFFRTAHNGSSILLCLYSSSFMQKLWCVQARSHLYFCQWASLPFPPLPSAGIFQLCPNFQGRRITIAAATIWS